MLIHPDRRSIELSNEELAQIQRDLRSISEWALSGERMAPDKVTILPPLLSRLSRSLNMNIGVNMRLDPPKE